MDNGKEVGKEVAEAKSDGLCLLSLDGGGVKGLSTLYILKRLMDQLNYLRKKDGKTPLKPCEAFHMIGGTSTGGLIAVMLGRLRMTVDECIEQYNSLIKQVFQTKLHRIPVNWKFKVNPRFSSETLRKSIEGVLASHKLKPDIRLLDESSESECKVFVCATSKETSEIKLFKTYEVGGIRDSLNPTLVEASLATSAATTFFEEATVGARKFVDGAFQANNPSFQVKQEAAEIWCSEDGADLKSRIKCFISIGTGHSGLEAIGDTPLKLVETLKKLTTKCEEIAETFAGEWPSLYNKRYFRFNVGHGLEKVGLEEFDQRALIEAATDGYLNKLDLKTQVRACLQALLDEIRVTSPPSEISPEHTRPTDFCISVQPDHEFGVKPGHFIERTTLLSSLETKLLAEPRPIKAVVNLWGLAGSGKTQLAHHFVRRNWKEYTACFKLHGRSEQEFRSGLAGLATRIPGLTMPSTRKEELGSVIGSEEPSANQQMEQQYISRVCDWLNEKENIKWLLMIDSVECESFVELPSQEPESGLDTSETESFYSDDSDQETTQTNLYLREYLDQLCQGTVILTSQHLLVSDIYPGLEVAELDEQESLTLIRKSRNSDNLPEAEFLRLTQRLSNHVQAIDSAAIYLKHFKHIDIQTYIKQWEECDAKIFKQEKNLANQSLFTTLKLAFDKLDQQSQKFLCICAFLDPIFIWADLFTVDAQSELECYLPSDILFDQMIRRIGRLLLISPSPARGNPRQKNGISVHPVLHKVVQRISITTGLTKSCVNLATNLISSAVPNQYEADFAESSKVLIPHAEQCRKNFRIMDMLDLELDQKILEDVGKLGKLFHENGQLEHAVELYDRALRRHESLKLYSEEYYDVVNSRGLASMAQGDLRKAQKCFQMLHKHASGASVPGHLSFNLLEVKMNYGITLRNQKRFEEAKEQLLDALKGYMEQAKDHRAQVQIYRIKQYLGTTYALDGDLRKAAKLVYEARVGLEAALEGDSIYIFLAAQELASIYRRLGSLSTAADQLRFAGDGLKRLCGSKSQYVFENRWHRVMLDFSICQEQEGDPQLVCNNFELLITEQETSLGRNHWLTLRSIRTFGQMLQKFARWQDAEQRLRTALGRYDFPGTKQDVWARTLTAMDLARNLWVQADQEDISELYDEALELYGEAEDALQSNPTTYAGEQLRDVILSEAYIIYKIGSDADKRKALLRVLSLSGVDELHRNWAKDNLYDIDPRIALGQIDVGVEQRLGDVEI